MPIPDGCIFIDPKHRELPIAKAKIERSTAWSMASRGVGTLGDLHGRPWASLAEFFFLREKAVEKVAARLEEVAAGRIPEAVPVATLGTPAEILDWLLRLVPHRKKHFVVTLRHLVDRETLTAIADDAGRSPERIRQRTALARNTARMRLPEVPAWRPLLACAVAVVDELTVVSDVALYGVLARELGWGDDGPTTADLRAMCALLAMVGPLVVVRREELVVLCRSEKAAWARIHVLERAGEDGSEELRLGLPDDLQSVFIADLSRLLELGGRRGWRRGVACGPEGLPAP